MKSRARIALLLGASLGIAGCARQHMENEPRFETFEASSEFPDGASARTPPSGAVPWQAHWDDPEATARVAITPALLARGRERYEIYCTPCHGFLGRGDGMVVQRGFPAPPSFHEQRLVDASDRHFYDVMTHGYGAMFSYAARVAPEDRRAIIAYIRALQWSQHASFDELAPEARARLLRAEAAK